MSTLPWRGVKRASTDCYSLGAWPNGPGAWGGSDDPHTDDRRDRRYRPAGDDPRPGGDLPQPGRRGVRGDAAQGHRGGRRLQCAGAESPSGRVRAPETQPGPAARSVAGGLRSPQRIRTADRSPAGVRLGAGRAPALHELERRGAGRRAGSAPAQLAGPGRLVGLLSDAAEGGRDGAGEQERRSLYLVVFGEQQPQFGEWDIDYRFAAEIGDAGERGGTARSRPGPQAPGPSFELPPEIEADRYLRQAEQAVRDGNAENARTAMERLEALQQEHGLEPSPEDHYRYAEAWEAAGERQRAMAAAAHYLRLQGRGAEHYTAALDLMNRAESGLAGPNCEGQAEGAECWKQLASHPSCHVWDDHYYANQTVTWTGGCAGGLASGTGNLKWVRGDDENEHTGMLREGKHHGQWVLRFANGNVAKGPYVDGKHHGQWTLRFANGNVLEGPYVDGKMHGRWVFRLADGGIQEGPYVDGKKHGQWVERFANGNVLEGPYVEGKHHGQWVERFANGNVLEGLYMEGKKHGQWVFRLADGGIQEGPYVDGKKHGRWVLRSPDGRTQTVTFVNGERQ